MALIAGVIAVAAFVLARTGPPAAEGPSATPAQRCSTPVAGTISVCPATATVGAQVTIDGNHCNNPGGPALIDFGTTDQFGQPTAGTYGAIGLGDFTVDANGAFHATVVVPSTLHPIQGQGGGAVRPGLYAIYSKPVMCITYVTIR